MFGVFVPWAFWICPSSPHHSLAILPVLEALTLRSCAQCSQLMAMMPTMNSRPRQLLEARRLRKPSTQLKSCEGVHLSLGELLATHPPQKGARWGFLSKMAASSQNGLSQNGYGGF